MLCLQMGVYELLPFLPANQRPEKVPEQYRL